MSAQNINSFGRKQEHYYMRHQTAIWMILPHVLMWILLLLVSLQLPSVNLFE